LNYCDRRCAYEWAAADVDDGYEETAPVGSFPEGAGWIGALDMAGNVLEWTRDWYGDYPSSPATNPTGPASGSDRVGRGGAWDNNEEVFRYDYRMALDPALGGSNLGFRCVRPASP
jgi:formylglycine-generating enzyme required for sulfatase activity